MMPQTPCSSLRVNSRKDRAEGSALLVAVCLRCLRASAEEFFSKMKGQGGLMVQRPMAAVHALHRNPAERYSLRIRKALRREHSCVAA